jgi:hypothetical protein
LKKTSPALYNKLALLHNLDKFNWHLILLCYNNIV